MHLDSLPQPASTANVQEARIASLRTERAEVRGLNGGYSEMSFLYFIKAEIRKMGRYILKPHFKTRRKFCSAYPEQDPW